MQQAGLPIRKELVLTSDFEFAGGFSAMQTLLSLPIQPQAVFTCNDAMAVGAYQAIYQKDYVYLMIFLSSVMMTSI